MLHGLYCYKVESVHFNCIQIRTAKSIVTVQLFHHTEIRQSLSVSTVSTKIVIIRAYGIVVGPTRFYYVIVYSTVVSKG